jgi:hypothetical protein
VGPATLGGVTAPGAFRSILVRLAWLAVAALIAFGAAGAVSAMQHTPGTPDRAELTSAGDRTAEPALDAAAAELQVLADEVDTLGSTARQLLSAVVVSDLGSLQDLIVKGTTELASVDAQARRVETALAAVPSMGSDSGLVVADDLRRRYDELVATTGLTARLEADWAAFTGRALDAATLTGLLTRHDRETADATKQGSAAHYKAALALLAKSDATIAEARTLAERLGKAADVATLTTWLDRNAAYDAAVRDLYQSLIDAKGRVTDKVRAAFTAEKEARANLPGDTRGLVVIMAEVAQGGLNQAVISIEQVRGALAAALQAQAKPQDPSAPPE